MSAFPMRLTYLTLWNLLDNLERVGIKKSGLRNPRPHDTLKSGNAFQLTKRASK